MTTIYAVSTGEYSDYGIHSMWTKKEDAEKLVEILNRDHDGYAFVEEYELDQPYRERPGIEVMIDLTTGNKIDRYKRIVDRKYPRDMVLRNGPDVRYWNVIREERIKLVNKVWTIVDTFDEGPVLIVSSHETAEKALKAAYDFRASSLAKLQGI